VAAVVNPEVLAVAQDPMCSMGARVNMTAGRLAGGQAWVRPLADGSRAVVLLNAGDASPPPPPDTCNWTSTAGGYHQCLPDSPAGNLYCSSTDSLAALKARCCAAGVGRCASLSFGSAGQQRGYACLKRNDDSGWVADPDFTDWKITGGQPNPPPPSPPAASATVCVSWEAAGLNPYKARRNMRLMMCVDLLACKPPPGGACGRTLPWREPCPCVCGGFGGWVGG